MTEHQLEQVRKRLNKMTRYAALVYMVVGALVAVLLPPTPQVVVSSWILVGIVFNARYQVLPPDGAFDSLGFWLNHFKMAVLWPLTAYWICTRGATVKRRDLLAEINQRTGSTPGDSRPPAHSGQADHDR